MRHSLCRRKVSTAAALASVTPANFCKLSCVGSCPDTVDDTCSTSARQVSLVCRCNQSRLLGFLMVCFEMQFNFFFNISKRSLLPILPDHGSGAPASANSQVSRQLVSQLNSK